jgi:hypothetical protein
MKNDSNKILEEIKKVNLKTDKNDGLQKKYETDDIEKDKEFDESIEELQKAHTLHIEELNNMLGKQVQKKRSDSVTQL